MFIREGTLSVDMGTQAEHSIATKIGRSLTWVPVISVQGMG